MADRIYLFGDKTTKGNKDQKQLLGGKGANLCEMSRLGIPVPPGFTITTEMCTQYYKQGKQLPQGLDEEIDQAITFVEKITGKLFGDPVNPLLLSVRSGSPVSMPGMMDTILNIGLNAKTLAGLIEKTNNKRFALDTYRRLIQMFSSVVLEISHESFEHILSSKKKALKVSTDFELTSEALTDVINEYLAIVQKHTGKPFPNEPRQQLGLAIEAVFRSWNTARAKAYRQIHGISEHLGTAVNVQAMVFGNLGDNSGTGVFFTRNPSTGSLGLYGEYLPMAQGEDVVAGIRTPRPLNENSRREGNTDTTLQQAHPVIYKELEGFGLQLEKHYKDMQDIEFTMEESRLWILQTRSGKRTAKAAVGIAIDMVQESLIDDKTAIKRVTPAQLDQLLHPIFDPSAKFEVLASGLPASPGAVSGKVVFSAEQAETETKAGEKVILVRLETSPEDVTGMFVSEGILTHRGGMTSHAAVVARGMGKCCVAGCTDIDVHQEDGYFLTPSGTRINRGDVISLNGTTGEVIKGAVKTIAPQQDHYFDKLMTWTDKYRKLGIRANADTPHDGRVARKFGAEGIGLCRTEHMFFDPQRIDIVRQMILAHNDQERKPLLTKLLSFQKSDFIGIFEAMRGLPVTIRLLDPPLHEFLPQTEDEIEQLALRIKADPKKLSDRIHALRELNPMLGHRGCRLGITYPDIYDMQVYAITEAACHLAKSDPQAIFPEIMVPLVSAEAEFEFLYTRIIGIIDEVGAREGVKLNIKVGTMIELPRAALRAGAIARQADFFSFGTNDLTQTTYGLSRDDSSRFLAHYIEHGIIPQDPFASIDQEGVLELVQLAVDRGRAQKPDLKLGVCGEHGGDPDSIEQFHKLGLDYISCSPFRVPSARLKAAQVSLATNE